MYSSNREKKAKSPVEFGAKRDISAKGGITRLEKVLFVVYNACVVPEDAINRFYERNGHYPERVLADKIYRNCDNLPFCKERSIRLSGLALGRPGKNRDIDWLVKSSLWRKRVLVFSRLGWYFYNCFVCKSNGAYVAIGR